MTDQNPQNRAKRENRKPWEHTIQVGINWMENLDGTRDAVGMLATCTCGKFSFPFEEGIDPTIVLEHTTPHVDSHPMPPVSTAALGDDSVVLVMAVPGPDNSPVHMSISVGKDVYDDGEKLAHHLGTIGSPLHFQILEQRSSLHDRMKGMGFHAVPLPSGMGGIERVLEMLRGTGHVIDRIDYMEPDGTVRPITIPGLTGLKNEPEQETNGDTIGKKPASWPGFSFGGSQDPGSFLRDYGTFTTDRPIEDQKPVPDYGIEDYDSDDGPWKKPDIKLGDIGPHGDEDRPDFDNPDEYAP